MKLSIGNWSIVIKSRPAAALQQPLALSDEEILAGMALADRHPTWLALEQLLGEAIEESVTIVSDHRTSEKPGLLTHTAGGIEALRDFRERLRSLRKEALNPKDDESKS